MTEIRDRRGDGRQGDEPACAPGARRGGWLLIAVVVLVALGVLSLVLVALAHIDDGGPAGSPGARGSGRAVSETRSVPPFSAVELAGGNNVSVRVGTPQSVVVHGDDNLVGRVGTSVRGGTLVVATTGSFTTRAPMRVEVVVPRLTSVSITGSGDLVVDGVASASFDASLPGSGEMLVTGRTDELRVTLDGSGEMNLHSLTARIVEVGLTGSGDIRVWASESLRAQVSGSGSVRYAGEPPHVTQSVTGSGAVEPE